MSDRRLESPAAALFLSCALAAVAGNAGAAGWMPEAAQNFFTGDKACRDNLRTKMKSITDPGQALEKEVEGFQTLVEYSLAAREKILKVVEEMRNTALAKESLPKDGSKAEGKPLTAAQIRMLNEGTVAYLGLRKELLALAQNYECAIALDDKILRANSVSPVTRFKAVALSLSAALVLHDNYLLAISVLEENKRLRKNINRPDIEAYEKSGERLTEVSRNAWSIRSRWRIRRAIDFYEKTSKKMLQADNPERAAFMKDDSLVYLITLIDQSPSYNFVKQVSPARLAVKWVGLLSGRGTDTVDELLRDGMNALSMIFGNTAGLYEERKGKLYRKPEVLKDLLDQLCPMDILVEKTPFRLTDRFIPGHWGHVAIWLGNEAELRRYSLDQHPKVRQYLDRITPRGEPPESKSGNLVVEALRSGVEMNTLEHFMNVDDVGILRPVALYANRNASPGKVPCYDESSDELRASIVRALSFVGKEYDFNFDIEESEKIVCSEIAYHTFPAIDFPTAKALGRYTISPDNVAAMLFRPMTGQLAPPLELILLYLDGEKVSTDKGLPLLEKLMHGDSK